AEGALHGDRLGLVAERGRGRVRVDVLHVGGTQGGIPERVYHRQACAVAVFRGRGDVIGIATHAEADELGVNARTAPARVLQLLQKHRTAPVAQHEAVAVPVPRAARLGGGLVARGERLRLVERAQPSARGGPLPDGRNA